MKIVMFLILNNIKEQFRYIKRNITVILIPIIIFVFFYGYYQLNNVETKFIKPITVGVVVEDNSIYSQMLVSDFNSKKDLSEFFKLIKSDKEHLAVLMEKQEIDAIVTIPEQFAKSLFYFDYNPVEVVINDKDPVKTMIIQNAFLAYENYIKSVEKGVNAFYLAFSPLVDNETYNDYNNLISVKLIKTALNRNTFYKYEEITNMPNVISIEYYFIALLIMFILYISLFAGKKLLREYNSFSFKRLMLTKVSIRAYIISNVIAYLLQVSFIVGIWGFLYSYISKTPFYFNNIKTIVYLVSIILLMIVFSMCITIFIKKETEYIIFGSIFVFFNAIIGGSIIPIHYMPIDLRNIAIYTFNYTSIKGILFLHNNIEMNNYIQTQIIIIITILVLLEILIKSYKRKVGY